MKNFGPVLGIALAVCTPGVATAQGAPNVAASASPTVQGDAPVDPASLERAREILTLAFPPEKREQMYATLMNTIVGQARKTMEGTEPSKDKDFEAVLDRSTQRMFDELQQILNAHIPDYFESMAKAYARSFSSDELNELLAFAKTPTGQHFFARSTTLVQDPDVQAASARMMADMRTKLPAIQSEIANDVAAYVDRKEKQNKPVS